MARSLSEDVEILARVTDAEKTSPAFRAGADYVLSVQRACARLAAAEVHGERVMDPIGQIRLVRADAAPFAGQSLGRPAGRPNAAGPLSVSAEMGRYTDERTTIEAGDEVFVAGVTRPSRSSSGPSTRVIRPRPEDGSIRGSAAPRTRWFRPSLPSLLCRLLT